MTRETLEAAGTCLLIFDLLEGHVRKDEATRQRFAPVIANAARLLVAARAAGAMVAFAHADHRADRATSARTLRDTDNRLRPIDPDDEASHQPLLTGGTAQTQVVSELAPIAMSNSGRSSKRICRRPNGNSSISNTCGSTSR